MSESIVHHQFPNGLILVVEAMKGVQSAAFTLLLPGGAIFDPAERLGMASVLNELTVRGAGERDSRRISQDLDNLGVERGHSASTLNTSYVGSTLAENLLPALEIYAEIVRRPHLPADQVAMVRALALQELQSVEDDPSHKVMLELRRRCYPAPYGRSALGTVEGIEAIGPADVAAHWRLTYRPNGTILGVAGNVETASVIDRVGELFGDWAGGPAVPVQAGPRGPKLDHILQETTQTQIGIAYESVPYRDPDYFHARAAVGVLSNGMSARLFTEVREKRGLCYAVYATHQGYRDRAAVMCYAGTTNERAQETLDVTVRELHRLSEGLTENELRRVQAGLKASLIMQQESTSARSSALAHDWYHLGRVRSLDEVQAAIEGLTTRGIEDYVRRYPARELTVLTLGPVPLAGSEDRG